MRIFDNGDIAEKIPDYLKARLEGAKLIFYKGNEGKEWSEEYKWKILPPLNKEFIEGGFSAENILGKIKLLQKFNPNSGTFVSYMPLDDLKKIAEINPGKTAELFKMLFYSEHQLVKKIDIFIKEAKTIKKNAKLQTPLFGYIFAAFDCNKFPLYKGETFEKIKAMSGIKREWKNFSIIGERYQKFTELCLDVGKHFKEQNLLKEVVVKGIRIIPGFEALDGQDFLYVWSYLLDDSKPILKTEIASTDGRQLQEKINEHVSRKPFSLLREYDAELADPDTNYFIFDSKGVGKDIDFEQYHWDTGRNNKVREGDLFIYRRPQSSSENGQFYLFGVAKIEKISGTKEVVASLSNIHPFPENILQTDLESFIWSFKEKGKNWEHFFSQYGMNQILKTDFISIIMVSDNLSDDNQPRINDEPEIEAMKNMEKENFFVDDSVSEAKVRAGQNVFSRKVKLNYDNKCAVCGLSTRDFLVGSHIVPWAFDKNNRLNPANGICLCVMHDKAFDAGFITFDKEYKIIISSYGAGDTVLASVLNKCANQQIKFPTKCRPNPEFLEYHRNIIFKK